MFSDLYLHGAVTVGCAHITVTCIAMIHQGLLRTNEQSWGAAGQAREREAQYVIVRLAPVLDLAWRSLNALLERLHHSYFLFVPLSPTRFVTVEVYLAPALCLLLALALQVRRRPLPVQALLIWRNGHVCLSLPPPPPLAWPRRAQGLPGLTAHPQAEHLLILLLQHVDSGR